jgi:hypothetical protein
MQRGKTTGENIKPKAETICFVRDAFCYRFFTNF